MATTLAARNALDDCRYSFELLKAAHHEPQKWRVLWASTITLLRAVGHVLDNTDKPRSDKHRSTIDRAWNGWKDRRDENAIFFRFIQEERNNVIKEYKFGAAPEPVFLVTEGGDQIVANNGNALVTEKEHFRLTLDGYRGRDGREVIDEAIAWWDAELSKIEAEL